MNATGSTQAAATGTSQVHIGIAVFILKTAVGVAILGMDLRDHAEMYLVSVLVVKEESFLERAYLDGLARTKSLPVELKTRLETEARAAQAYDGNRPQSLISVA